MPCCGPGYGSPKEAIKGREEKILFVTCAHTLLTENDAIATVDVDPQSPTYCQVIAQLTMPNSGDELHHFGWNACSSCHDKPEVKRTHIIVPGLNSNRIYIINTEDPMNLKLEKTIEGVELEKLNVTFPHTTHCLADGKVMISTLGDYKGENRGNFLLLDGKTFEIDGLWLDGSKALRFNYGFWYQPRLNIMISTEWGSPNKIKSEFDPSDVLIGHYGHSLHVFNWDTHEHLQSIELPMPQGAVPMQVRFLHDPASPHAFVAIALGTAVFHLHPKEEGSTEYVADLVIDVPRKKVEGWLLPEMPGLMTDMLISMDDKFMYLSNFLHGDVRQYDISDPSNPKMTGKIFIGGSLHTKFGVRVTEDKEHMFQPEPCIVKNRVIHGGPHMLQLSLDGKRLYVTTSMYRKWDEQFYPQLSLHGATMLRIDVESKGGIKLNEDFLVDFAKMKNGPYLAHEMRYPGGDCTSDIWL